MSTVAEASLRCTSFGAVLALLLSCGTEQDASTLVGTVERTEVEISAPGSEILVAVAVQRGSRVGVGDLLAQLDDTVARAERDAVAAGLEAARAIRAETQGELARVRGLHRSAAASPQNLDRARRAYQEVVAVLHAEGPPWVRVWCPARAVARLSLGSSAEVRVQGIERLFHGRVIDIAREPEFTPHFALTEREREHIVYQTRVEIVDAPVGLRPGLPAEVRFSTDRSEKPR
jgi:HlyD family secretion protein